MPVIATTCVARWAWGRRDESADELMLCLRELLTAYSVLAARRLAVGPVRVPVSVQEAGKPNSYLFRREFKLDKASPDLAQWLADQVKAALQPGKTGAVGADATSAGMIISAGKGLREERLFHLGASAGADFVSVDLMTFSDVWMPYDLKGRAQPAVHSANAPRLSAALRDLAEALGSEIDADGPTYFGKPHETGIENRFEDDGTASDVWSRFEIPSRYRQFTHAPGFGRIGYKRTADGAVQYMPVRGEHGVLGYLWASNAENAASFEPRDVGDEEVYKTGLSYLKRLRSAHDRGLSPSQALVESAGLSEVHTNTLDLASLRKLASRD
jgi:hypothetical protein